MEKIQSTLSISRIIFIIISTCALCFILLIFILGYQEKDLASRHNRMAIDADMYAIKSFLLSTVSARNDIQEYLTSSKYILCDSIIKADIYVKTNSHNKYVTIIYVIDSNIISSNTIKRP